MAPGPIVTVELLAGALDRMIHMWARGTLIDAGCGRAPLRAAYSPKVEQAVALDWPSSVHGGGAVEVFADVGAALPLGDLSADTVSLTDVPEHLVDPGAVLSEIHRVLRPGGVLLATFPYLFGLHEEPYGYARYTEHGLRQLATSAGLRVVELVPYGGSGDVIVDLAAKHLAALGLSGRVSARVLQRGWLALRAVPVLGRLRLELRRRYPLGYAMVAER